jgi:lysozyme family protein
MTQTVRQIAEAIVAREGGFVNDPDDPGGATKHGVTIGTMKALGLDLTKDGKVTVEDVKALTQAQAVDIYIRHYFEKPGIASLPAALQATVFDMQVNAGANAVKILQRTLTALGFPCAVDGDIGPGTIRAAQTAVETKGDLAMADAYGIARRNYYYALADSRPASRKYARRKDGGKGGWITRSEEFISPKLHLTDAQHRARVANWS